MKWLLLIIVLPLCTLADDPVEPWYDDGFIGVMVNVSGETIGYIKEGTKNLIDEPVETIGRNLGKTILAGLGTWKATNSDGFDTSMQDAADWIRGKKDREEEEQQSSGTAEGGDGTRTLHQKGDGNYAEGDFDDVIQEGNKNTYREPSED